MSTQVAAKDDPSNGYEAIASEFMRRRGESNIGAATVRSWSRTLPSGATILDLGCGHGIPFAMALIEDGFNVYGIDASPTLVSAFRSRFPHTHVTCGTVEASDFFARTFDGVLAIGLIFLLDAETQRGLIRKVAQGFEVSSFDSRVNFSGTILNSDRNSVVLKYSLTIQKRVTYSDEASDTENPFQTVQSIQGGVHSNARIKLGEPIDLLKLGPESVRLTVTVVK